MSINESSLYDSIKFLKGVGPERAKLFNKLGIKTIHNLLTYFPKRYEDRKTYKKIAQLTEGETTTITGKVEMTDVVQINPKLAVFKAAISDSTGIIYATFYKKPNFRYDVFSKLKKEFTKGTNVILYGKVEKFYNTKQIRPEEYEILRGDESDLIHTDRIVPIYQLTEGLNNRFFRTIIKQALDKYLKFWVEILPEELRIKNNLPDVRSSIQTIHFPENFYELNMARKRLSFDEFLLLELAMVISKKSLKEKRKSHTYQIKKNLLTPFKQKLGFEFTKAQKKVINEIFNDMLSEYPMNRLLIGDVGSGKTVVALSAVLLAIENNYQTAFMAPTEILAEQHYYTIKQFLSGLDVKIELLTGSTKPKHKKTVIEKLAKGEIDILIGTHALIEEKIKFRNLKLVVIDEQHKFGVTQRQKLLQKGGTSGSHKQIDVLIMTATPIPRTLSLTIYGDLDISTIDELPPGRKPVKTLYMSEDYKAYEFVKNEIEKGHQAWIVFPLVEESDKLELKSAVNEAKKLKETFFSKYNVGLLHGQMPGKEKEKIMLDFRAGLYDILITTTVIEIGLDVPNATIIVIEHADRFGLATLHQLRGRVGRSKDLDSYCILLGEPKTEEAKKRIEVMLSTNDGFLIAEKDLEIRGSGEFFGTAQHGLSELKIGNILEDSDIINKTRNIAEDIIQADMYLSKPEYRNLKIELLRKYGGKFGLSQVG